MSVAILGRYHGGSDAIVSFLERETEGNAFFLVEAVRALAEQSGRLDRISADRLPEHVFPGGIQATVRRRLGRLPTWAWGPLQFAAVLGRDIDLAILQAAELGVDVDEFLVACSYAAILEGHGYNWRFSHDKLREGVLLELDAPVLQGLHLRVARAIEEAYRERPEWVHELAFHWSEAGVDEKAAHYLQLAAGQMLATGVTEKAALLATDAARHLGVEIPDTPQSLGSAIGKEMEGISHLMATRRPADLVDLPQLTSQKFEGMIQVLKLISPAAHISHKLELFTLCALKSMALSLEHGIGPYTPEVFATYAAVVRGMTGDGRGAYDFGQV
ncbi:MAG: hypothetical protein GY953_56470, partial [bacterium]|nr:hypothetical protein [bacterium]